MKNFNILIPIFAVSLTGLFSGCGDDPVVATTTSYTQIERLARPAINEGLIISNTNAAAWNSVAPSADLTSAASGVVTEASAVLTAIAAWSTVNALTSPTAAIVSGFLPDVMRIDTAQAAANATEAYKSCVSGALGILCGGRKLDDNVMKITLSYLAAGNFTAVSTGPTSGQGHVAAFPYLPLAN